MSESCHIFCYDVFSWYHILYTINSPGKSVKNKQTNKQITERLNARFATGKNEKVDSLHVPAVKICRV